ncbi:hypothetical protein H0H93_008646 [Arthromyces matolae]|nr:hypothetical protein H0H93_008646 [Arthromyces matolae]
MVMSSEETTQAEGEGSDGPDRRMNGTNQVNNLSSHLKAALNISNNTTTTSPLTMADQPPKQSTSASSTVPLPPPESGIYDKEPGYTRKALQKLVIEHQPISNSSTLSTPSAECGDSSLPPTRPNSRPPSQPPSRAPSMSSGVSGNKLNNKDYPNTKKPTPQSSTSASTITPQRPAKPSSVYSDSGSHKFNLKDLLASGPKVNRRTSQRSVGSSKRSDSDAGSDSGRPRGKSTAGDSAASFSQKYGVCQKVAVGKGATSVVRLAHKWDRTEEKLYAVKQFRARRKNETEKEYVKKLTAEFCISSTLHHPNIVETVDLIQDENQHWCEVMEFCPGGDLYAAIKKGQGVAHRDIKPENLFFDMDGHLKIGDYGASTVYRLPWEATVHMSTGLCGSEPYIAPEQFLGKPYDARLVDIWACGIVYYCLHFQELPWRAAQPASDSLFAAYLQACQNPTPAMAACPPTINNLSPRACRPLIRKMLDPDPKQRATIEEVVAHPWIKTIEVCHEVKEPKHIHVSAKTMQMIHLNNGH